MENGEWRMENGEWRMENGEWRMENGEWRMDWRAALRSASRLNKWVNKSETGSVLFDLKIGGNCCVTVLSPLFTLFTTPFSPPLFTTKTRFHVCELANEAPSVYLRAGHATVAITPGAAIGLQTAPSRSTIVRATP